MHELLDCEGTMMAIGSILSGDEPLPLLTIAKQVLIPPKVFPNSSDNWFNGGC